VQTFIILWDFHHESNMDHDISGQT